MKRKQIFVISTLLLLLICFTGCEAQTTGQETGKAADETDDFDIPIDGSYHSNPIDHWRKEMLEEYGYEYSGPISYEYKNAWKEELEYYVQQSEAEDEAAAYLEAIEQTAETLANLWDWHYDERDGGGDKGTGGDTVINEEIAQVYKNGVFQFIDYSTNYFFDPETATEKLKSWHY